MLTEDDIREAERYAEDYLLTYEIPPDNREAVRLEQFESFLVIRLIEKSDYEQA